MLGIENVNKASEKIVEAIACLECPESPYLCDDCGNRLSCDAMHDALIYLRKIKHEYYKNKLAEVQGTRR